MFVPSIKTIVTLGVAFYATAALAVPNVQMGADVQDLSERNEALEQPDFDAVAGLGETIEARGGGGKPPRRPNNNNNNRRPNGRPNGRPRRPTK